MWWECFRTPIGSRVHAQSSKAPFYWQKPIPCGVGFYGTKAYAGAQLEPGAPFHGGWTFSGSHFMSGGRYGEVEEELLQVGVDVLPPPESSPPDPSWDPGSDSGWEGASTGVIMRSIAVGAFNFHLVPTLEDACEPLASMGYEPYETCPEPSVHEVSP